MADFTQHFASDWTLTQTQHACEVVQHRGYQLQTISPETQIVGNETFQVNRADFKTREPSDVLQKLLFVVVGNQDPAELKEQKKREGWAYLHDEHIYVEGELEWVMVFAKKD